MAPPVPGVAGFAGVGFDGVVFPSFGASGVGVAGLVSPPPIGIDSYWLSQDPGIRAIGRSHVAERTTPLPLSNDLTCKIDKLGSVPKKGPRSPQRPNFLTCDQDQAMKPPMYPVIGTTALRSTTAGMRGGGKEVTGMLLINHPRAVAIIAARLDASSVLSSRMCITGGGSYQDDAVRTDKRYCAPAEDTLWRSPKVDNPTKRPGTKSPSCLGSISLLPL